MTDLDPEVPISPALLPDPEPPAPPTPEEAAAGTAWDPAREQDGATALVNAAAEAAVAEAAGESEVTPEQAAANAAGTSWDPALQEANEAKLTQLRAQQAGQS